MEPVTERFLLTADHGLSVLPEGAQPPAQQTVVEPLSPTEFYQGFARDISLQPWLSGPIPSAFEATQEVTVTLTITSAQPAASTTKAVEFPPVGGWIGAGDRYAVFFGMADAPDTLEAGKVYVLTTKVAMPKGALFVRQGESVALYTYLSYQTANGGSASYVVGGETPSVVELPHTHFELNAPRTIPLVEESGAFESHPGVTSEDDPSAAEVVIDVPTEAAYVVIELTSTAGPTGRIDADLHVMGAGGELGAATGPTAREIVVLGPHALAQARSLTARVQSASLSGGAWTLTATAYAE